MYGWSRMIVGMVTRLAEQKGVDLALDAARFLPEMPARLVVLGSGDKKRQQIRHLAKHLNLYGGTTLLDCLTRTDIISILEDEYAKIVAKPEFLDPA